MVRFDCGELVCTSKMALMVQPYVLAKSAHSVRCRPQAPLGLGETWCTIGGLGGSAAFGLGVAVVVQVIVVESK